MRTPRSCGFTLIELLIVVAIIAILAAIAVPNFLEAQTRAKVSRTYSDMRTLATAMESYAVDHNFYPLQGGVTNTGVVVIPTENPTGLVLDQKFLAPGLTTPVAYLTSLLMDPFAETLVGPDPEIHYYFYNNFPQSIDWLQSNLGMAPPLIAQRRDVWGEWALEACGPDLDRKDIEGTAVGLDVVNGYYDPTNGTVSNGDILRTQRFSALGGGAQ